MLQTVSIAEQRDMLLDDRLEYLQVLISAKHCSAVEAWKHGSGHAISVLSSLMTILGGRLLNMTKAVSSRNI